MKAMSKKIKFSDEQLLAIETVGHNILVSAGAGSGKTAVLSERVSRLVEMGFQIDRFLILTFTNLAASEMKDRIKGKILENPKTASQINKVEAAHIETFDAFALYIVKRYKDYLGLGENTNIIDGTIIDLQKKKIISNIFEELYESGDQDFEQLIRRFCVKDDSDLQQLVLDISNVAKLATNKFEYIDTYFNKYNDDFIKKIINDHYKSCLQGVKNLRKIVENFYHLDDANMLIDIFDELLITQNYDEFISKATSIKIKRAPTNTPDKDTRAQVVETFKALISSSLYGDTKQIIESFKENDCYIQTLLKVVKELFIRLDKFMYDNECFDFQTIASLALKSLQNPDICKEMKESFDFILVDEYQDTSDIQEDVINLLKDNNVYMVGDIKQSIYRFRNANPDLFIDKYNTYKLLTNEEQLKDFSPNEGLKINLNKSFRSRREVVDSINSIFSKLMNKEDSVIDYSDGHNFEFGQTKYDENYSNKQNYSTEVLNYEPSKTKSNSQIEAEIIADDIINKLNNGYMVYKKDVLQEAKFDDFCIIVDRKTDFDEVLKVFNSKNIPLNVISDERISKSDVVIVIKNLVTLLSCSLNNDYQSSKFVHAFLSISRSFISDITDKEIYQIYNSKSFLTTDFMQKIELIKEKVRYSSLRYVLMELYETFNLYEEVIKIGDIKSNIAKLEMFINFSNSMDLLGYSLDDLVLYFNEIDEFDIEIPFQGNRQESEAVTLINIHKSKGLEYQVCYFMGLKKNFYNPSEKSRFSCTNNYGIILPIKGFEKGSFVELFSKKHEKNEDLQEKLRLYYVALTRTKEKIIILNPVVNKLCDSFTKVRNLKGFNDLCGLSASGTEYLFNNQKLFEKNEKINPLNIKLEHVDIECKKLESKRYSKSAFKVDEELLDFGNRLHFLLEIVDYESKDVSFIMDDKERSYIQKVLNLPLFTGIKNNQIHHEYQFIDENGQKGVVDCLIIHENHIDIIDFKTKNIDDDSYLQQLNNYKKYIKSITDKDVKLHLVSIIDGREEEIDNEG